MAVDAPGNSTSSTTTGLSDVHSGDAALAITYAVIIALVVMVPSLLTLVLTYRFRIRYPDKPFVSGLSRTTMTMGIIATVGIALGHILVRGLSGSETSQLVTAIVSGLLGALASMVGFYFGQKSTEAKPSGPGGGGGGGGDAPGGRGDPDQPSDPEADEEGPPIDKMAPAKARRSRSPPPEMRI